MFPSFISRPVSVKILEIPCNPSASHKQKRKLSRSLPKVTKVKPVGEEKKREASSSAIGFYEEVDVEWKAKFKRQSQAVTIMFSIAFFTSYWALAIYLYY